MNRGRIKVNESFRKKLMERIEMGRHTLSMNKKGW